MAADLTPSSVADESGPISAINVTPFVDVVLVLLVIFMVTAPVLMKDSFGIHLPKAQNSDSKTPPASISIVVTQQGQILINGQLASPDVVIAEVKQALVAAPEVHAMISADGEAKHSDVVRAIDLVKTAGVEHFAIQIEKP